MSKLGYAVVTMHPMEFASRTGTAYQNEVDDGQIHELELLMDDIHNAGFRIVTVSQVNYPPLKGVGLFLLQRLYSEFPQA
jgi:hypothetical protein